MQHTRLISIANELERFEASESRAHTGTGSRREGEKFEHKVLELWDETAKYLSNEAKCTPVQVKRKRFNRISFEDRQLYLPTSLQPQGKSNERESWFDTSFSVAELINNFPGKDDAIKRYSPTKGPYGRTKYPNIYSGLTTRFDGTIICVDKGVLAKKILLEYKTGKASKGEKIDGNAHERLSFQIMQYLEVATRYPQCSLAVITNGAFIRYRNKYHPLFHQQADRLTNFRWFEMEYCSFDEQYLGFIEKLKKWIFEGK